MPLYAGMTVNERLSVSGQFTAWDQAVIGRDRAKMIEILMAVELTLHGATRVVDVVVNLAGPVTDDRTGLRRFGATAVGQLRRSDFGVDAWLGGIADLVDFTVNVQAVPASVPDDQLPPAE